MNSSDTNADIQLEFAQFLRVEHFNEELRISLVQAFVAWYIETHSVTFSGVRPEGFAYNRVFSDLDVRGYTTNQELREVLLRRFQPARIKELSKLPTKSVVHVGGKTGKFGKKQKGSPSPKLLALR